MSDRGRLGVPLLVAIGLIAVLTGTPASASVAKANAVPAGLSVADLTAWHGHGDLAFVSKGRLLVLDGSNDTVRAISTSVAAGSSPQFSPDGRWLVYQVADGTYWMARADGTNPRKLPGDAAPYWLPDGKLLLGSSIYEFEDTQSLMKVGTAPADIVGWSAHGNEYVFETDTLKVDYPHSSTGIERVETATSLDGDRTL